MTRSPAGSGHWSSRLQNRKTLPWASVSSHGVQPTRLLYRDKMAAGFQAQQRQYHLAEDPGQPAVRQQPAGNAATAHQVAEAENTTPTRAMLRLAGVRAGVCELTPSWGTQR